VSEQVLHDLQLPRPIGARVAWEPGPHHDGGPVVLGAWRSRRMYGAPSELGDGPAALVCLADHTQEQLFPETNGAWREARPQCPGHPHPAIQPSSENRHGGSVLIDGARISPIGQLTR
jgi:hypothetical protein